MQLIKLMAGPVLLGAVVIGIWLYPGPSSGMRELERSRDAVRMATSWHAQRSTRMPDGSWQFTGTRDVGCPTDFDETIIRPDHGDSEHRVELHGFFYRQLPNGVWQRSGNGLIAIPECGRGPYLESFAHIYSDLDEIEQKGDVRSGNDLDSDGVKCHWWHITVGNAPQPRYSVCIDAVSHLPLIATSLGYGFSYGFSNWNHTTISAPVADLQPSP